MFIKLTKNGRNRIVSENDQFTINGLLKDGYTVVCDEAGVAEKYNMYRVKSEIVVESGKHTNFVESLNKSTETVVNIIE